MCSPLEYCVDECYVEVGVVDRVDAWDETGWSPTEETSPGAGPAARFRNGDEHGARTLRKNNGLRHPLQHPTEEKHLEHFKNRDPEDRLPIMELC